MNIFLKLKSNHRNLLMRISEVLRSGNLCWSEISPVLRAHRNVTLWRVIPGNVPPSVLTSKTDADRYIVSITIRYDLI